VLLKIPGAPIPKHAPRLCRRTGRVYSDQTKQVRDVRIMLKAQYRLLKSKPMSGPMEINFVFFMPLLAGWSKKKKKEMVGQPHVKRPDRDNLLKFIQDCMNGIVYDDDSQVWNGTVKKIYGKEPRTIIAIVEE
jgi:Holliday junction resolvase RusA-like endonuclease